MRLTEKDISTREGGWEVGRTAASMQGERRGYGWEVLLGEGMARVEWE